MMGYIVYFQMVKSPELIQSPYNARIDSFADYVTRGDITDREGNILAHTDTDAEGNETRSYPYENIYSHVIGYHTQGKYGLEGAANIKLLTSNSFFLNKILNEFSNHKNQGDKLVTTLDTTLQAASYNAMGYSKGAVVIMDPKTGEILSMVSKPDFDPNQIDANWDSISNSDDSILLNRAVMGRYAPGSTFKLITTLELMRENPNYMNYEYTCNGSIYAADGDVTIQCYNGTIHGYEDLEDSIAYSCNTSFSNIGTMLDVKDWKKTTKELLFDTKLPCPLSAEKSTFPLDQNSNEAERMMTAMGQGRTEVTPYHMALITSAIANDGVLMKPYLISSVESDIGNQIETTKPEKMKRLMSASEAAQLKSYMESVVKYGTGTVLSGQSYEAAGKTGTAEYSEDVTKDHSWFVGIAEKDGRQLAISIVIEQSDGTTKAVNVAKSIFDSYFQ